LADIKVLIKIIDESSAEEKERLKPILEIDNPSETGNQNFYNIFKNTQSIDEFKLDEKLQNFAYK
jgi:hypothetical protein